MSVRSESLLGVGLMFLHVTWMLAHPHGRATHTSDVTVVLSLLGAMISLHANYRRARRLED